MCGGDQRRARGRAAQRKAGLEPEQLGGGQHGGRVQRYAGYPRFEQSQGAVGGAAGRWPAREQGRRLETGRSGKARWINRDRAMSNGPGAP